MRVRSATWLLVLQMVSRALAFPVSVYLSRALGRAGKGDITLTQLIIATGMTLLSLGLGAAFTYRAARREASGRTAIKAGALYSGIVASVVAVVVVLAGRPIAAALNLPMGLLLFGSALVPVALLSNTLQAFSFGTGQVRNTALVQAAAVFWQFLAYSVLFVSGRLTIPAALVVIAGSYAIELTGMAWLALHSNTKVAAGPLDRPVGLLRGSVYYGLAVWFTGIAGFAALRADTFILAHYLDSAAVGVYSISVTLAELTWLIPTALGSVMIPKVAGHGAESVELTCRLGRITWVTCLLVGVGLLLVASVAVPVIWGRAFAGAVLPLGLLLPGIVIASMSSIASAYIAGIGKPNLNTRPAIANVIVNIAANVILIPRLGIAGAALASSLSYSVASIITIALFVRETGVPLSSVLVPRWSDLATVRDFAGTVLAYRRSA